MAKKNTFDIPAHEYAGLTLENMESLGFSVPSRWNDADVERGSIVDFVVVTNNRDGSVEVGVKRMAVGNVTYDKWDDEENLYLRWPYEFDEEYATARGFKLVVAAPTSEDAGVKAVFDAIEEAFGPVTAEQHAYIKLRIDALRCAAMVAAIDWDSSSLYC